jgi:uncharacterized protein YbjT (DUF2867 family)
VRLLVFGASGNCGSHFVRLAALHGHDVTAVVRAQTHTDPAPGVSVARGDVGDSRPVLNWPMRLLLGMSNVGKAYADLERVEATLRSSGLDWQAVRPTTLTHRRPAGSVHLTDRYAITASIPREDVVGFMLRELEAARFTERTPIITGVRRLGNRRQP